MNLLCIDSPGDLNGEEYSPYEQPNMYLSQRLIDSVINKIRENTDVDENIIRVIISLEEIHRAKVLGEIAEEKESQMFKNINTDFGEEYGIWLYQTKESRLFYKKINID